MTWLFVFLLIKCKFKPTDQPNPYSYVKTFWPYLLNLSKQSLKGFSLYRTFPYPAMFLVAFMLATKDTLRRCRCLSWEINLIGILPKHKVPNYNPPQSRVLILRQFLFIRNSFVLVYNPKLCDSDRLLNYYHSLLW